ncbi:LysE family translocator [Paracoccus tegillarcae]|uniref:LysE family translocator n=1 Tax=Paracoccus tegillarcae TaxID=1529068 RepID=A0A2K9F1M6_9RHOB|nr:LysE family translocator [Paracoccus tegillarcae]AUH34272.1 hypothetical protein CUV01_13530 [Paracoccus tegillarcae]
MQTELLLAFSGFAAVTLFTPGPNNMMLMASGANFGIRRSLPHLFGVALGFPAMVALMGLGIDRLFAAFPALVPAMQIASFAYMIYLAWRIAHAGAPRDKAAEVEARPFTFLQAAAFQWVNPKAWAMGLGALSVYAAGLGGSLWVVVLFAAIGIPSAATWTAMGQGLRRWLARGSRLVWFNRSMAVLLVVSMLPVLFH